MQQSYVLITGATSGIGYELARLFAEDGHNLILVARTKHELEKAASAFAAYGIDVVTITKDLFQPNAPFELYEEVKAKNLDVGILVNDAGQGQYGPFVESDIKRQLEIIQLNIASLTALTWLFLKDMIAKHNGKILQLASIASNLPGPLQSVYHATKAYVLSFTEALVNELKDTGVTMTALQPGVTDTDFFNKAQAQDSKLVEDKSKMSDPADVAKDGYKALMQGEDKVISGMKNKLQVTMSHVMPDTMIAGQIRKQSEKRDE